VLNQNLVDNSTGPRDRPSPAWGLVENRPALFRRRRPSGARRAVNGAFAHRSMPGRSRRPETGWPAGPAGSGRPRGPCFVGEFLTHDTRMSQPSRTWSRAGLKIRRRPWRTMPWPGTRTERPRARRPRRPVWAAIAAQVFYHARERTGQPRPVVRVPLQPEPWFCNNSTGAAPGVPEGLTRNVDEQGLRTTPDELCGRVRRAATVGPVSVLPLDPCWTRASFTIPPRVALPPPAAIRDGMAEAPLRASRLEPQRNATGLASARPALPS